jgi:hypothetical protein
MILLVRRLHFESENEWWKVRRIKKSCYNNNFDLLLSSCLLSQVVLSLWSTTLDVRVDFRSHCQLEMMICELLWSDRQTLTGHASLVHLKTCLKIMYYDGKCSCNCYYYLMLLPHFEVHAMYCTVYTILIWRLLLLNDDHERIRVHDIKHESTPFEWKVTDYLESRSPWIHSKWHERCWNKTVFLLVASSSSNGKTTSNFVLKVVPSFLALF